MQHVAHGVWQAEQVLSYPGGVRLPSRMTALRLDDGTLALISPVRIDDARADALSKLGEVSLLVAPNRYHHLFLTEAIARYPNARVLGAPGLPQKRPDVTFSGVLLEPSGELPAGLRGLLVGGSPKLNEVVLYHEASRSLVMTDFVFHFDVPANWQTKLALKTMGSGYDRLGQSYMWTFLTRDAAAARASAGELLALPFDRLVLAHGAPIETGAKAQLAGTLRRPFRD